MSLVNIHLHGALGAQFGKEYRFAVESVGEVIAALRANFPAFENTIRNGFYRVVLGKNKSSGLALTEEQAARVSLAGRPVHIVPAIRGRKRGLGKVIAGIALIAFSVMAGPAAALMATSIGIGSATIGTMVASVGVSMIVSGVATMIAPEQKAGDDKKSFAMSGPQSNLREGNIVPIAYGEVVTGGYMISGGIEINGPKASEGASPSHASIGTLAPFWGGSASKLGREPSP